jgi:hypothetical protein
MSRETNARENTLNHQGTFLSAPRGGHFYPRLTQPFGNLARDPAQRYHPVARAIFHGVIKSPDLVRALEDADLRSTLRSRTYYESLDLYLLLWEEARRLNPSMGADWLDDVQCDIEIARTLNARP